MKKFPKWILAILSLLGILQVLWFVYLTYPFEPKITLKNYLKLPPDVIGYLAIFLAAVSGIALIIMLLYVLFVPTKYNDITFKSNDGNLKISKSALEKIITNRIKENPTLHDIDVKIKILGRNRKAKMFISAMSSQDTNLKQQGEEIKHIANEQLKNNLNVPIKNTIVKLSPFESNQNMRVI
ncbi:hypothetical protein LCR01_18260 [Companilactobacillus crustorum]|uniref:Alkaline shock response membrane anchor protein AmaP n=3 Tax=Companilactobacillus TaxID=2767879 RepID=A0A837RHK1_9LACO|nr:alkaline shock response membrane anchor protein AmaP [Companilactobacillus crustorum]HCD07216.1 alkaline shock response membrane anchor protein AmaP [Lactobacillus sp.]APU72381.1 hypothetical protein BI355_2087 [Companilactobacillus crustorum]KRK41801.1 hypothetical protein FD26_GL001150 [Companilactobacillus crustorum JCM 15951]KRO20665.1 hypothetical protein IV63_GL000358 [Companilactobacillus crustorum]WDT65575.1 alkaline shock response membrane anchor protein AmaP [Companilactobacillus 